MKRKGLTGAIAASALSAVLCAGMLAGTTFAWFTDTVTSTGNTIVAGNLGVSMWQADAYAGADTVWTTADSAEAGYTPVFAEQGWAPGSSVIRYVKIANDGELAVKYKLEVLPMGEAALAGAIDVYFGVADENFTAPESFADVTAEGSAVAYVGTLADMIAENDGAAHGSLEAGGEVIGCIALHMREDAGNEYMNAEASFTLRLSATQDTEDAAYGNYTELSPAGDAFTSEEFLAALNGEDANISFKGDISVDSVADIDKDVNLDFAGNTVTLNGTLIRAGYSAQEPINITIDSANFRATDDTTALRAIGVSTLTVKNSTFYNPLGRTEADTGNTVGVKIELKEGVKSVIVFENCSFYGPCGVRLNNQGSAGDTEYELIFRNCDFDVSPSNGGSCIWLEQEETDYDMRGSVLLDNCSLKLRHAPSPSGGGADSFIKISVYRTTDADKQSVTIKDSDFYNSVPKRYGMHTYSAASIVSGYKSGGSIKFYAVVTEEGTNSYRFYYEETGELVTTDIYKNALT